ncbi:MAG: hypothetical protein DIJKHBIC_01089 [Thermoanaerobaculia bacterium]|nr:hypothetical protein [Thermoanaerobaculia bacterium]
MRAVLRGAARALYRALPGGAKSAAWFLREDIRTAWCRLRHTGLPGSLAESREGFTFLYPPNVTWNHLFQRPHQMARALAGLGHRVVFCTRDPGADGVSGLVEVAPRLFVTSFPPPIFNALRPVLVISRPTHAPYVKRLTGATAVYDFIDELMVYEDFGPGMEREHLRLLSESDVVLTTATRLQEKALALRPDAVLCPNGVDYEFFRAAASPGRIPADMEPIPRPRIGYYGALARWVDYELIRRVARQRPDWNWVLIGPQYDASLTESGLLNSEHNVHWLGHRPYETLPDYLRGFDVATIPFLLNDVTKATSPVKLFEYLAGGKPVVTTAMDECLLFPGVVSAVHDSAEFVETVEQELRRGPTEHILRQRQQTARANGWETRARHLLTALESIGAARRSRPAQNP